MERALLAAATGMAAQQQNLDAIADDLANADVPGFKGSALVFAELVAPGTGGVGTVSLGSRVLLAQGKFVTGGGPCDLAIDGPGFFTVLDAGGRRAYTRDGSFARAADGTLRNARGLRLEGIKVPADALLLRVLEDGTLQATFAGGTRAIGRIRIAAFPRRTACAIPAARSSRQRRNRAPPAAFYLVLRTVRSFASACSSAPTSRSSRR